MGTRLPSAGEVLIIRPTGKKGFVAFADQQVTLVPRGHLPGSQSFQSAIRSRSVQAECSRCIDVEYTFPKSYS